LKAAYGFLTLKPYAAFYLTRNAEFEMGVTGDLFGPTVVLLGCLG
jgi:hypothetical protein